MRVLLDTHILIWAFENNPNLPSETREIILDEKNEIYYSSVSTWEIAIKHSLHPKEVKIDEDLFIDLCNQSGFKELTLSNTHIQSLSKIKSSAQTNHKDPFDRILMAQSVAEQMTFITKDRKLAVYELPNMLLQSE